MLLEEFLDVTEERLPRIEEMMALCDTLGITFIAKNGKPYMKPCPDCQEEAKVIAKLFKREPFRTMVIERKLSDLVDRRPEPAVECLWPGTGLIGLNHCAENEWPVGAFYYRKIGETTWVPIPGRTWDAETKRGVVEKRKA